MYKRPNRLSAFINRLLARAAEAGIQLYDTQALTVRGRSSGVDRTVVVSALEIDGATYLVAPRGTTHWARNLRAAGEGELRLGRRRRRFTAEEIPVDERPPILRQYLRRYGGISKGQFEADADAPEERLREIAPLHPTFRLELE